MNKVNVFLVAAAIATGNLAAQSSRFESVNGKVEQRQNKFLTMPSGNNFIEGIAGDNEKATFEKKFSDNTTIKAKSDIVRHDGRIFSLPENSQQNMVKRSNLKQNVDLKNKKFETTLNVKKSTRDDVATITLRVIGDPFWDGTGVQMILDADAEMFDIFWDHYEEWDYIYDLCEYKIPENASPDFSNIEVILDGEGSVDIPAGAYDFVFLNPITYFDAIGVLIWAEDYEPTLTHNFTFEAGFEYLFQVSDNPTGVEYFPSFDAKLIEIMLPLKSTELTNQEEVKVVLYNNGSQNIEGNVEFLYKINNKDWIQPEAFSVSLEPSQKMEYTFVTKADFSETSFYTVEVQVNYNFDLNNANNNITGFTKNPQPRELPFIENFDTYEDFILNWAVIDKNKDGGSWIYCDWNPDADGNTGCLKISSLGGYDYLISDPLIITDAGKYNISFYGDPIGSEVEKVKVLYGTSSDPDEMELLEEFTFPYGRWHVYIKNFEITNTGNYYFAFHYCTPTDDFPKSFELDKIKITAGEILGDTDIDIKINNVFTPVNSCDLTDTEAILGVEVSNMGLKDINEFTLTYQIGEKTPVSQTFTEFLEYKESLTVYFNKTVDFSSIGDYFIHFTASIPNEFNTSDNEIETLVRHYAPVTEFPFNCDFTIEEGRTEWYPGMENSWTISNPADFYLKDLGDFYYFQNLYNNYAPLISRCIAMERGEYMFRFNYIAGRISWMWQVPADFYVACGKSGTDYNNWEHLNDYEQINTYVPNIQSFEIVEDDIIIYISEDGVYEFAFFLVNSGSGLGIFNTSLDRNVGISTEKLLEPQLTLYPNPAKDELRVENGELKMEKINIYNAVGQVMIEVSNINSTSFRLNVEKLNAGLYFISVQTKDGVMKSKFVVK